MVAVLACALAVGLTGCGTEAAPQPPSLNLPDRVTNLAATRTGNQVSLTWTMPKKNTDKLLLKGDVNVRVCRKEDAGPCEQAERVDVGSGRWRADFQRHCRRRWHRVLRER